ncbi:MAG TPA: M48 family metallopeptidase [Polyangiaceae bacterium]|nr:M48 family metallopeptidase [Polyangiaceae bacterium]
MTRLAATYYDGVTSQAFPVELSLDERGLLHVHGLAQPLAHALDQVRIDPRLGNTTRSVFFPDGAKCESDDHPALDELLSRAGRGRYSRLIHGLESSWRAALGATIALIAVMVLAAHWGIPFLARRLAEAIPPALAYDLGRGTLAVFDRTLLEPSHLPSTRQDELSREFAGMSQKYPDLPLSLVFRRGIGPNAFALPDGTVIVTDELTELAQNDQEVMAVLAHEIGHVHHRHSLRMALESSTVVLLISAYLGDVTQLTTLSASLPGVYAQARYSRDHETEADTFSLHYMDDAGIPHVHFANILRSLQRQSGRDPEGGFQYLASHPPTSERIRRFEK